jgi:hypothetical protein
LYPPIARAWRGLPCAALAALACSTAAAGSERPAYGSACGIERWAVKTLMDPQAAALPSTPVDATVARLAQLQAPANAAALVRRKAPVETTLWRVRARLAGYRIEADGDLHLVLTDPASGRAMIGEIPAPYCTTSPKGQAFAGARAAVERIGHHRASRKYWWWLDYRGATPPLVEVTGYGFWDVPHDQTGAARNAIELHPVLSVRPL